MTDELKKEQEWMLRETSFRGKVFHVDLWYPRLENKVDEIEVGLMDVRAADSIRISYDFHRDGWVVKQASVFEWDADDDVCDEGWTEVAFIPAWQLETPSTGHGVKND